MLDDRRNIHAIDDLSECFAEKFGSQVNEPVKRILMEIAEETDPSGQSAVNHGLISAIDLLRKTSQVKKPIYENEIMSAAVAMAVHDRKVWKKLHENKLVPLNISNFPLACLLILCDTLESWGRPGFMSDPEGIDTKLCGLNFNENIINTQMCFKKGSDGLVLNWELQEILKKIIDTTSCFEATFVPKL